MEKTKQQNLDLVEETESLPGWCFRSLSPEEEAKFRAAAREKYQVGTIIEGIWHPVYRDECRKMNAEARAQTEAQAKAREG